MLDTGFCVDYHDPRTSEGKVRMKMIVCVCTCVLFTGSGLAGDPALDRTVPAPDGNITGLAWSEGVLWCLDATSRMCYGVDPMTGSVQQSFLFSGNSYTPAGLACNGTYLFGSFVNSTASTYVYWYTTAGTYIYYDILC
jgi:hypothetical protein